MEEESRYSILDNHSNYQDCFNFIIYKNKIIGLQLSSNINVDQLFYSNTYISKDLNENDGKNIINNRIKELNKILKKDKLLNNDIKQVLIREFKNLKYSTINYLYNPHEINKIIYSKKYIIDNRIKKLNESLYHTNLYNLLLIHFSNKLSKMKNNIIRSKIKHAINNLNKNEINLILSNKFDKMSNIINKNITLNDDEFKLTIIYNLNSFIKNIILLNLVNNNVINQNLITKIKKNIIENLDSSLFLFDSILINNILKLEKKEAIKELNKVFNDIIIHTNLNYKSNVLNLELCDNIKESYLCQNNKLIISKELYNTLLEILYYDLTNPFKQKLILNLVNYNLNNIYNFKQYFNEQIYIYI